MKELIRCLWILGLNLGFRYWKLCRAARRNPELARALKFRLSELADEEPNKNLAWALRDFSSKIKI